MCMCVVCATCACVCWEGVCGGNADWTQERSDPASEAGGYRHAHNSGICSRRNVDVMTSFCSLAAGECDFIACTCTLYVGKHGVCRRCQHSNLYHQVKAKAVHLIPKHHPGEQDDVHVASCRAMSCRVMSRHVMSSPIHAKSCYVISRHVTSCDVLSCHIMSCDVMSCHVMSYHR